MLQNVAGISPPGFGMEQANDDLLMLLVASAFVLHSVV